MSICTYATSSHDSKNLKRLNSRTWRGIFEIHGYFGLLAQQLIHRSELIPLDNYTEQLDL